MKVRKCFKLLKNIEYKCSLIFNFIFFFMNVIFPIDHGNFLFYPKGNVESMS